MNIVSNSAADIGIKQNPIAYHALFAFHFMFKKNVENLTGWFISLLFEASCP